MRPIALNLIAIAIFGTVLSSLVGPWLHLSPVIPATVAAGVLVIATIDTLGLEGRGGNVLLDWLTEITGGEVYRERVIHHEAGHFLVAHLLEIPISGYALSTWEALRQGQPGQGGVMFDTSALTAELSRGTLKPQTLDRYCTVWMAGIAAEKLVFGDAQGGQDDRQKFAILGQQFDQPLQDVRLKQRWAELKARTLLEAHQPAYLALVEALRQRIEPSECLQIIQQHCTTDPEAA